MATLTPTRVKRVVFAAGTSKSAAFDETTPLDSTYLILAFVYLANSTTMTPPVGWASIFGGSSGTNQIRLWGYQGDGVVNGLTWTSASAAGAVHLVAYPDFAGLTPLVAAVSTNVTPTTATYAMPDFGAAAGHGLLFDFIGSTGTHVGATLSQGTVIGGLDAGGSMLVGFEYQDGTGDQSSTVTMPSSRLGRYSQVVMPIGATTSGEVLTRTADGGISLGGSADAGTGVARTATGGVTLSGSAAAVARHIAYAGLVDFWPPTWGDTWGNSTLAVSLSGTAAVTVRVAATASGGVVLSGTAVTVTQLARTGTAGVTLSGTAAASIRQTLTATGGLTLAGNADATIGGGNPTVTATGGVALTGTAPVVVQLTRTASAGVTLTGIAVAQGGGATVTAMGGLTLSGSAVTLTSHPRTATGVITLTGAAAVSMSLQATAAGVLTLAGVATATVGGGTAPAVPVNPTFTLLIPTRAFTVTPANNTSWRTDG